MPIDPDRTHTSKFYTVDGSDPLLTVATSYEGPRIGGTFTSVIQPRIEDADWSRFRDEHAIIDPTLEPSKIAETGELVSTNRVRMTMLQAGKILGGDTVEFLTPQTVGDAVGKLVLESAGLEFSTEPKLQT